MWKILKCGSGEFDKLVKRGKNRKCMNRSDTDLKNCNAMFDFVLVLTVWGQIPVLDVSPHHNWSFLPLTFPFGSTCPRCHSDSSFLFYFLFWLKCLAAWKLTFCVFFPGRTSRVPSPCWRSTRSWSRPWRTTPTPSTSCPAPAGGWLLRDTPTGEGEEPRDPPFNLFWDHFQS